MNKIIFSSKYLVLDYQSLFFSFLILSLAISITIFLINKKNKYEKKFSFIFVFLLIWFFSFLLLSLILVPSFNKITFFQTKALIISPLGLSYFLLILVLNFMFFTEFKKWFLKSQLSHEKRSFIVLNFIVWIISIHFILKIFFINYTETVSIVLLQFKNFTFTLFDLIFVLLTIASTILILIFLRISINRLIKKEKIEEPTAFTVLTIIKYFIWTTVIVIILQTIGLNLSVLLAGSAALLVGIGLGIQQVFNDFASGLILLLEREIKVGDYVEADTVSGNVLSIGFRTTVMTTRDNVRVIIPNSKLVSDKVINWTKGESYARVGLDIGVAYGSDTHKVKDVLLLCATEHEYILKKPAPEVFFLDFSDSSLDFRLYFYTAKIFFRETIKSDLRFTINDEFHKANIQIPFPQMDVHLPNANLPIR